MNSAFLYWWADLNKPYEPIDKLGYVQEVAMRRTDTEMRGECAPSWQNYAPRRAGQETVDPRPDSSANLAQYYSGLCRRLHRAYFLDLVSAGYHLYRCTCIAIRSLEF